MRPDDFEDRLRDALRDSARQVVPDPRTWNLVQERARRSRWRWLSAVAYVTPLLAVLAVLAGLGVLDRDRDVAAPRAGATPFVPASPSSAPAPTTSPEPGAEGAAPLGTAEPTPAVSPAPSPPATSRPSSPGLLVADDQGIAQVEQGAREPLLDRDGVMFAVGDLAGGLVFQEGPVDASSSLWGSAIWWLPAGEREPRLLLAVASPEQLSLQEVVDYEGRTTVVFLRGNQGSFTDRLEVLPLDSGEPRLVTEIAAGEGGANRVSYHPRFGFLYSGAGEGCSYFGLLTDDGVPGALPGNPKPEERACEQPQVQDAAFSPDGTSLAWVESPDLGAVQTPSFEAVARELETGEELLRVPLADVGEVAHLDYDGARLVISSYALQDETVAATAPLVVDVASGEVAPLPLTGVASLD